MPLLHFWNGTEKLLLRNSGSENRAISCAKSFLCLSAEQPFAARPNHFAEANGSQAKQQVEVGEEMAAKSLDTDAMKDAFGRFVDRNQ